MLNMFLFHPVSQKVILYNNIINVINKLLTLSYHIMYIIIIMLFYIDHSLLKNAWFVFEQNKF